MRHTFVLLVFCAMVAVETAHAQDDSWIITLATGDTLSQCSLISVDTDSLRVTWSGFPVSLPLGSLRKLQYHRTSEFWRGAFYGTAVGALAGTFISSTSDPSVAPTDGLVGAVTGFVVGGFIADYMSRDDRYDLQNISDAGKKNLLTALLLNRRLLQTGDEIKR